MTNEEMHRYRRQIASSVAVRPSAKTPARFYLWIVLFVAIGAICAAALIR